MRHMKEYVEESIINYKKEGSIHIFYRCICKNKHHNVERVRNRKTSKKLVYLVSKGKGDSGIRNYQERC